MFIDAPPAAVSHAPQPAGTAAAIAGVGVEPVPPGAVKPAPPPPRFAADLGLNRLTFSDEFDSPATIDLGNTHAAGYNWYAQRWFVGRATPPSQVSMANSVLTLGDGHSAGDVALVSAIALAQPAHYVGSVFSGAAYFEARIAFDPADSVRATTAFPAWWALAIEHVYDGRTKADVQWSGQAPGYAHFTELDFFEQVHAPKEDVRGRDDYSGTIHDWSGVFKGRWPIDIWPRGHTKVSVGSRLDTGFHTYGCIYVPAHGATPGFVQWVYDRKTFSDRQYFRGPPVTPPLPGQSSRTWSAETPELASATYSIIDQQRLALSLMTDNRWPMRVDYVRVWQH
jgi:hypothetical protein